MSSRIFKDKMGKKDAKKGATYKQADLSYDPALVEDVIDEFLRTKRTDQYIVADGNRRFFEHCVNTFERRLWYEVTEEFNHQDFLDALVAELTVHEPEDFFISRMDTLFSCLIQGLYRHGRNGFRLDAFHFSHSPYRMASYLTGNEDNLLDLTYNGPVWRFAEYPQYCRLENLGDTRHMAGDHARDSKIILHMPPEEMGDRALGSKFYLHGVKDATIHQIRDWGSPPRIEILLEMEDAKDDKLVTVETTFFRNGNSLYITEGTGWRKVR